MPIKEDIGCPRSGSHNSLAGFLGLITKIIIDGQKVHPLVRLPHGLKGYGSSTSTIHAHSDTGTQATQTALTGNQEPIREPQIKLDAL
jgi:hypothetical protein